MQWSTASTTTRASKISGSTTDSISSHGPLCDFDKRKGGNGNSAPTLRRWAASALLIAISGCGTAFAQNARRDFADARGQPGEYKLDHGGRSRRPTKVSASRQYWVDAGVFLSIGAYQPCHLGPREGRQNRPAKDRFWRSPMIAIREGIQGTVLIRSSRHRYTDAGHEPSPKLDDCEGSTGVAGVRRRRDAH